MSATTLPSFTPPIDPVELLWLGMKGFGSILWMLPWYLKVLIVVMILIKLRWPWAFVDTSPTTRRRRRRRYRQFD